MAYSIDFRKQAIAFINEGLSFAELKQAVIIFPSTLAAWHKRFDESGQLTHLHPHPVLSPVRLPTINSDSLITAVVKKPDASVCELALPYDCPMAVCNALKKQPSTYAKNLHLL
jgi:transposase-like protein